MLRHVSYAREHCATLRSKPAVAFGPSTFSSPWSIRVLPMLRCPAHAWEARQQRAWPGSMQQLHAASDSHADSGAQTQTVAQPRDAPASATSTESLTQPMLTGAEASADLYGKWWTCAGWEALPKHVDLPNVHPGITKSDFYRLRDPRLWTPTTRHWDISFSLFSTMFPDALHYQPVDFRLEIDGRLQVINRTKDQVTMAECRFFQMEPSQREGLEVVVYNKKEGSKRQSDPLVRVPRAASYAPLLQGKVLLGYRVERYDPAYTAPLLVAIFASLPGGANLEMLQQRGRGKSSGKRLLEAGTLAANAAAAGAATNSTTGSSSGTSGSTDGTAASGTTSAPTFAAAGGVVSCANARPLTAASLRDYGIPMPYNVFKELLDVEGGQLQPDGSTWEVAVQVQVKGLTPQADTPTFDGCTVRVKRMRSGRLERVLITGVPAPFRRGLTGCKVVNWELVWGEGQARQLQQVAGAGRQDGPGPLLVLEVVGAEGQADA